MNSTESEGVEVVVPWWSACLTYGRTRVQSPALQKMEERKIPLIQNNKVVGKKSNLEKKKKDWFIF